MTGESIRKGWRIIADGVGFANDSIPAVLWASTLWFIIGFLPATYWLVALTNATTGQQQLWAAVFLGIFASLLLAPATVAAHELLARAKRREYVGFKQFFTAFAQHFKRASGAGAVTVLLGIVILGDIVFFMGSELVYIRLLSIVWIYFVAFWVLMLNYVAPLIVWQPQTSVLTVVKRAALLTLDNVVITIMLSLTVLLFFFVSVLLRIPIFLLFMGAIAAMETVAIERLLSRYVDSPEADPQPESDQPTKRNE